MAISSSSQLSAESIRAERARRSFALFVKDAWPELEPSTPLLWNFHIEALCIHLQALYQRDITRLVIGIAPGHAKSTIVSQMFPVWCWLSDPYSRWLCASHSLDLAIRDNRYRRRLIESEWFKTRYGHIFQFAPDQRVKSYYENSKKGYHMAVAVRGSGTGKRADILLCLCYNVEVTTDKGRIKIGEIVEKQLPVRVLAFDHTANSARWQEIEKYEKNPGKPCVRVTLNDGRTIDTTADHPFYVVGRGYVPASQLTNTDKVITDDCSLRELRERIQSNAFAYGSVQTRVLQQGLSQRLAEKTERTLCMRDVQKRVYAESVACGVASTSVLQQDMSRQVAGNAVQYVHMRSMQKRVQASTEACCTGQASVLQPRMSWGMGEGGKQSSVSRRQRRTSMRPLPEGLLSRAEGSEAEQGEFLFEGLPVSILKRGKLSNLSQYFRHLCFLRQRGKDYQAQDREEELLFTRMCQQSPQQTYQRGEQWALYRRWRGGTLFQGVLRTCSIGQRARWTEMCALPANTRTERQRVRRTSRELRQGSQRSLKSSNTLSLVPREDARVIRTERAVETLLVRCVEPLAAPEYTYNLRIAEDHNFFANGVLVHNCDDPNNAMAGKADIAATVEWYGKTWVSRQNDPQNGPSVVVGQRLGADDLIGHILALGGWEHLCLPEEFEIARRCRTSLGWTDPRKEEGELLWPAKFPRPVLEKFKQELGSINYAAQYQQSPVPAGGAIFKEKWFRYCSIEGDYYTLETPEGVRHVAIKDCWRFTVADVAISTKQSADWTVIQTFDVTPQNELLLIDQVRGHFDNPTQQKLIRLTYFRLKPQFVQIETVAYQLALVQQLRDEPVEDSDGRKYSIPIKEYKPVRDKVSRASAPAILMENGKFYFLKTLTDLHIIKTEYLQFPKGSNDDIVDCGGQASEVIFVPQGPMMWGIDEESDARSLESISVPGASPVPSMFSHRVEDFDDGEMYDMEVSDRW